MRLSVAASLLAAAVLVGCPPPAPPPPPPPNGGTEAGPKPGTDSGPKPGTDAAPAPEDAAWTLIPAERVERVYPTLHAAKSWPAPGALRAPKDVPEAKRPKPERVKLLIDLAAKVVHPSLWPKDPEAAIGVDDQGRTFLRLGKERAVGSASLDVKSVAVDANHDFPVLALAIDDAGADPQTLEKLEARVRAVVTDALAREMASETAGKRSHALEASPQAADPDGLAAMAMLDRSGFGERFPYFYAWGSGKHLLVVLQEVPFVDLHEAPR